MLFIACVNRQTLLDNGQSDRKNHCTRSTWHPSPSNFPLKVLRSSSQILKHSLKQVQKKEKITKKQSKKHLNSRHQDKPTTLTMTLTMSSCSLSHKTWSL